MIPTVEDLRSSPLVHRFGDVFNPPGLTNFLGTAQVDVDPFAIRSLTFPPFSCGDVVSGSLSINGKMFPAWGAAVSITWLPDRIERVAEIDGFRLSSTTVMVVGRQAAVVRLRVENFR